jgi:hypothetical protein
VAAAHLQVEVLAPLHGEHFGAAARALLLAELIRGQVPHEAAHRRRVVRDVGRRQVLSDPVAAGGQTDRRMTFRPRGWPTSGSAWLQADRQTEGREGTGREALRAITTGIRILCAAGKQGPKILFCVQ